MEYGTKTPEGDPLTLAYRVEQAGISLDKMRFFITDDGLFGGGRSESFGKGHLVKFQALGSNGEYDPNGLKASFKKDWFFTNIVDKKLKVVGRMEPVFAPFKPVAP